MSDLELALRAVSHDPCRVGDRAPAGAVPAGTAVRIVLRVDDAGRASLRSATLMTGRRRQGAEDIDWREVPLEENWKGYSGEITLDFEPHVLFYAFRLDLADGSTAYYVPRADGRATAGELVVPGVDGAWTPAGWVFSALRLRRRPMGDFGIAEPLPGFQVTAFDAAFESPAWMPGTVMYQIFPDRFARAREGVLVEGLRYHELMGRPVHLHGDWNEPVEWYANAPHDKDVSVEEALEEEASGGEALDEGTLESGASDDGVSKAQMAAYDPIDFFGGSLEGVRQKLPYIASLGVGALYLNPVFESRSNHRYDTADYERIDAILGTAEDLSALAEDARRWGIELVLDVALSHTGNDSRYFNALGSYEGLGAMQGSASPYYSWYDFEHASGKAPYRCWWGHPTLPEVDERDPSWQAYMLDEGGVLGKWLSAGIGGYRLDVADEIPDDVLERIRTCVKGANPDAAIIGEVWEDATTKDSYGVPRTYALGRALDSVMNYPLRSALLGFALGIVDACQLASFLKLQKSNYPPQLHACLMNLLSSHDVERLRSVLSLGRSLKSFNRKEQYELVAGIRDEQDVRAARLQRMVVALLYALPGMPCVYYGDELGLQGGGDPFCRATFPWDASGVRIAERADRGVDLRGFYRRIGAVRKDSDALRRGIVALAAPHEDVICVVRVQDGGRELVVAAANRSGEARTVAFDTGAADFGLPTEQARALRSLSGCIDASFTSASEREAQAFPPSGLCCEDGIFRLDVPALSTVYWQI